MHLLIHPDPGGCRESRTECFLGRASPALLLEHTQTIPHSRLARDEPHHNVLVSIL